MAKTRASNATSSVVNSPNGISTDDKGAARVFGCKNADARTYQALKNDGIQFCLDHLPLPDRTLCDFDDDTIKQKIWDALQNTWRNRYAARIQTLRVNLHAKNEYPTEEDKEDAVRDKILKIFEVWNKVATTSGGARKNPKRDVNKLTVDQLLNGDGDDDDDDNTASEDLPDSSTVESLKSTPSVESRKRKRTGGLSSNLSPVPVPVQQNHVSWEDVEVSFLVHAKDKDWITETTFCVLCNQSPALQHLSLLKLADYLAQTDLKRFLPLTNLAVRFEGSPCPPQRVRDIGTLQIQFKRWSYTPAAAGNAPFKIVTLEFWPPNNPFQTKQVIIAGPGRKEETGRKISTGKGPSGKKGRDADDEDPDSESPAESEIDDTTGEEDDNGNNGFKTPPFPPDRNRGRKSDGDVEMPDA